MKAATKKEWVKALRSGKYQQGRDFLCMDNRFCCLGVLYDVAIDGYWVQDPDCSHCWITEKDTKKVGGWITPYLKELGLSKYMQNKLSEMNDRGASFDEIADYIEKKL